MKRETENKQQSFSFKKGHTLPMSDENLDFLENCQKALLIGNLRGMIVDNNDDGKPSFFQTSGIGNEKAKMALTFYKRFSDVNKFTHFLVHEDDLQYYKDFIENFALENCQIITHRLRGKSTEYKIAFVPPAVSSDIKSSFNIRNEYLQDMETLNKFEVGSDEQDKQIKYMLQKYVAICLNYTDGKLNEVYTDHGNITVIVYKDNKMFTNVYYKVNKLTGEKIEIRDFDNVPKMFNDRINRFKGKKTMTYDFILMNPPYDGDLHLKIMENAIRLLNNDNSICVNLSPCGLVQKFYTLGKNKIRDFNIIGNEYSVDIKRVPIESAMELFDLDSLGQDLGIWSIRKGSTDINALSKSLVPNVDIVDKIKNVMVKHESLKSKQVKYKNINGYPLKFVYGLTLANHGGFGKSCYAPTSINYDTAKIPITGNHTVYRCFNTEEQRKNAHQLYTLMLMRFYYKSVGMNDTPYEVVADFDTVENPRTHKVGYESDWTNEDLCKVFGIIGFITDTEAEEGSEWETVLETMKPYL